MKSRIKNFCIPFLLMFITNLGYYYLTNAPNFGGELNPHLGILFIAGLFFGPWGSLGAVIANVICDVIRGYTVNVSFLSGITSFVVSVLAYKLWYTKDSDKFIVTRPRLNNSRNLIYLLFMIFQCGIIYSLLTTNLIEIFYQYTVNLNFYISLRYFINFFNFSLLFSNISILICKYRDFSYKPKISDRKTIKEYHIVHSLIVVILLVDIIFAILKVSSEYIIIETVILILLLMFFIGKPINHIDTISYISIPERVMNYFIVLTMILLTVNMLIIASPLLHIIIEALYKISSNQHYMIFLILLDITMIFFFVPALILLRYIEAKVIDPVKSFSRIESFIKKDERIESEGILDIYSDYIDQDDEIGVLSRSYTNLIDYNNEYIDNLETLEGEKQRINTELNIAHNIQNATLPSDAINNEYLHVDGFCRPAKAVGGDFYDFYELDDDNTMIMIGDASGKGVPAAIFTIIIQNSIKLLIKNEYDPANVLCDINSQICEKNPEMMFITLFLAIYNNKSHTLTYANAGHNPPIIKCNGKYELLNVDSEIVLGVMGDYEYTNHEVRVCDEFIIYTDGITDSHNDKHELYGDERIIDCLNNNEDNNIINALITDVDEYSKGEEQFDDMTLLVLKVRK